MKSTSNSHRPGFISELQKCRKWEGSPENHVPLRVDGFIREQPDQNRFSIARRLSAIFFQDFSREPVPATEQTGSTAPGHSRLRQLRPADVAYLYVQRAAPLSLLHMPGQSLHGPDRYRPVPSAQGTTLPFQIGGTPCRGDLLVRGIITKDRVTPRTTTQVTKVSPIAAPWLIPLAFATPRTRQRFVMPAAAISRFSPETLGGHSSPF